MKPKSEAQKRVHVAKFNSFLDNELALCGKQKSVDSLLGFFGV